MKKTAIYVPCTFIPFTEEDTSNAHHVVIPIREPLTLHQTGSYLLLFPSLFSAKTYQEHLVYLHRTARTHTPTSIQSPLPPPPGYQLADGEDVYQLLQEYALIPPSQRLSLRLLVPPYSPMIRSLLEKGGYEEIVRDRNSNMRRNIDTDTNATNQTPTEAEVTQQSRATSVLFWIDGHQPSTFSLKETLARDGRDRGLPWSIALSQSSPGSGLPRSGGFMNVNTPLAITKVASPQSNTLPTTISESEARDQNDDDDDDDDQTQLQTQVSTRKVNRWIIRFDTESEARRFVRAWHQRPWPWPSRGRESAAYGDEAPLVGVEALW